MGTDQIILGVDAGGTKTEAWLARAGLLSLGAQQDIPVCEVVEVIGRGGAGPGNPRAVGFEQATQSLLTAITSAYTDAALPRSAAAAACLGVAGAGRPAEQLRLHQWCQAQGVAAELRVVGDAVAVLAAACGQHSVAQLHRLQGMALISGTGSLAWGCNGVDRSGAQMEARVGGWGYLLGDEGSGYWLAVEGLRAACRAADGVGAQTKLLPALLAALQLQAPQDLVSAVYGQHMERRRLAQLATVVLDLAGTQTQPGDPIATAIMEQAALELSRMVVCLRDKLQLGAGSSTLALTGGVLLRGTVLRNRLLELLQPLGLDIHIVQSPVLGGVYLAASALHKPGSGES